MAMAVSLRGVPAAVVVLAGVVTLAAGPPQQEPLFKSGTRTVPVYATVTDRSGRLVPDLQRDDFRITDQGRPQEITVFANTVQPISVVLMLDRSTSVLENFDLVRDAAEAFVDRLLPDDKARIGSFAARVQVDPQAFISDKDQLRQILRTELQDAGPTPLWNAVEVAMNALDDQDGRRVVLVFTDGVDSPGTIRNSNLTERDVTNHARRDDIMVYAIGLTGDIPSNAAPRAPVGGGRARGGFPGMGGRGGFGGLPPRMVHQQPDEGLGRIAAETGGGYFELDSSADLAATFTRVAEELHHQYALGFTPDKLDGKTHDLDVSLTRNGMTARARRSYVARP
ncbi:MAG: VWA domain-containing protein [Vicinamibacterales bacterium]